MILRMDRPQMELPPPSDPDPAGAPFRGCSAVGSGEVSTFMNRTVESIKVCGPQRAGLSDEPTGVIAGGGGSAIDEAEDAVG